MIFWKLDKFAKNHSEKSESYLLSFLVKNAIKNDLFSLKKQ